MIFNCYESLIIIFLVGSPKVTPTDDHFIPVDSPEDVTYSCSAVDPGDTVFWEIGRQQITTPMLFTVYTELGISIHPNHTNSPTSLISSSEMGRRNYDNLIIQLVCLSQPSSSNTGRLLPLAKSDDYYVTSFGKLVCIWLY